MATFTSNQVIYNGIVITPISVNSILVPTGSLTSFSILSGTLPTGLTLNTSTGIISGTPILTNNNNVSVSITAGSDTVVINFTCVINAPQLTSSLDPLTTILGSSFTYTLASTNVPTSYTASNLPFGLSIVNTSGVFTIQGNSTTVGVYDVTINAINPLGISQDYDLVITVNYDVPTITNSTTTIEIDSYDAGFSGNKFTGLQIVATNYPTSYSIFSGALPTGLTLNTTTGLITGIALTKGVYTASFKATNATGSSSAVTFTFNVNYSNLVVNKIVGDRLSLLIDQRTAGTFSTVVQRIDSSNTLPISNIGLVYTNTTTPYTNLAGYYKGTSTINIISPLHGLETGQVVTITASDELLILPANIPSVANLPITRIDANSFSIVSPLTVNTFGELRLSYELQANTLMSTTPLQYGVYRIEFGFTSPNKSASYIIYVSKTANLTVVQTNEINTFLVTNNKLPNLTGYVDSIGNPSNSMYYTIETLDEDLSDFTLLDGYVDFPFSSLGIQVILPQEEKKIEFTQDYLFKLFYGQQPNYSDSYYILLADKFLRNCLTKETNKLLYVNKGDCFNAEYNKQIERNLKLNTLSTYMYAIYAKYLSYNSINGLLSMSISDVNKVSEYYKTLKALCEECSCNCSSCTTTNSNSNCATSSCNCK